MCNDVIIVMKAMKTMQNLNTFQTEYTVKLNLARNCLRYLIKLYNIKKILIPFYSCKSIWAAVKKENCKINFYHMNNDFLPSENFNKNDFILYINYFGLCNDNCKKLSEIYPNIIIDNTQAFYAENLGLASFNSLRKFFNVQNGAYLYTKKVLKEEFEEDKFLFSPVTMQKNYEKFVQNELLLDNENIKFIYPKIEDEMRTLDLNQDKLKRREKFLEYHQKFHEYNLIKLDLGNQIPYCYPLSATDKKVLNTLSDRNIPLLSLWGNIPKEFNEYKFLNNTVALPLIY